MIEIAVGKPIPKIAFKTTDADLCSSQQLLGQTVVLYFYPRDNTPGCTTEAHDFRDNYKKFQKLDAIILGVSRDSLKTHENFIKKHNLPFPLISDDDEKVCSLFDVIKLKNMYGKKVRGIERSTFLIDKHGKIHQQWRKVKVPGHVDEVLTAVKALS